MSISLSFDIGHSSIGWAALNVADKGPKILGCGSVVFPAEDCQNQKRAGFRRQRRHIAATRNRIKRLEEFLINVRFLSEADVQYCREHPNPWPWLMAAKSLKLGQILSAKELWSVLRWYAHNRGYDGNALWAGEDSDPDDVKKVQAARALMDRFGAGSMCETVCALLEVDVASNENPTLKYYFKGENAAFPRRIVVDEVRAILLNHVGKLTGVNEDVVTALLDDWNLSRKRGFDPKLAERYKGGLLFGQLKPRFENRIIPTCRITGDKTPSKHSREFYKFRWAMLMNNIRVNDLLTGGSRPLSANERAQLNAEMEVAGFFNKTSLKKVLVKQLNLEPTNLESMFLIPEMEEALTLDPAKRYVAGKVLKGIWDHVPESWQTCFLNQLFQNKNYKGAPASFAQWRNRMGANCEKLDDLDEALLVAHTVENEFLAKKDLSISFEDFCSRPIRIAGKYVATGRAPYSRIKLVEAYECVLCGEEPRAVGGPLEETEVVRNLQRDQEIDQNTNNHLVRHRLKIFKRTLADLVKRYANGDPKEVSLIGVEVVRDLVLFSGKTAKEKAQLLGQQLAHHRKISKYLEEEKESAGLDFEINAGLIKKVRIADDMDWTCPYTGKRYSLSEIIHGHVDREHIIPRSKRPTDSMHALVLTFSEINREKGARTGLQYIEDTEGASHTFTPKQYSEFVSKLKKKNGPSKDDELRCTKRKIALLTRDYGPRGKAKKEEGVATVDGFTEGSLSQTSHLNKLAAQQAKTWFAENLGESDNLPQVIQLSGSVTAAARRAWDLFGPLNEACPETRGKIKSDIREITHLHHALDAVLIGFSAFYFPKDGHLWALLSRRKIKNAADQNYMRASLGSMIQFRADGEWEIKSLPEHLKESLAEKLSENRVVMHVSRTLRGLDTKETNWGYLGLDEDGWHLARKRDERDQSGIRKVTIKKFGDASLFGVDSPINGKLKANKTVREYGTNFGVFLSDEPIVMQRHSLYKRIGELVESHGSREILLPGMLINIRGHKNKSGLYRIKGFSTNKKYGARMDMVPVDWVGSPISKLKGHWQNANVKSIMPLLEVVDFDYSGVIE